MAMLFMIAIFNVALTNWGEIINGEREEKAKSSYQCSWTDADRETGREAEREAGSKGSRE